MSFTTTPISEVHLLLGGDPISFDDMEIPEDAVRYHFDGYDPYVHTPEMYREHSKKMMGHKSYETQRKAVIHSNKTRIVTAETRKKMSESQKNRPPVSIETGKKISKAFIPTSQTKGMAQMIRDDIADMKIKLQNYNEFKPELDRIERFVTETLAELPDYVKPKDIRTLQREINRLYQEAESKIGAGASKQGIMGGSLLARARKALTQDLNDYANWAPGLNAEEKVLAESAKKIFVQS